MNKMLKIVFMGTPDFSVPVLEGLIQNYQVELVVSQPDRKVGRKQILTPTPVKQKALEYGIEVFQPENITTDYQKILEVDADIIITCAYGQILPKVLLESPKYKCINVHASLLPKLRGGAPIHKAIINNYPRTGITIMYMVEKMDAGDILAQRDTIIQKNENVQSLHDRLSVMGCELLLETLPKLVKGEIEAIPQNEAEVTYAWNITREEEKIDFNRYAIDIHNQIRGLSPFPGAYATLDGKIFKIYKAYIRDSFYTERKNGEISRIYDDGIGVSVKDLEIVITDFQIEGKKRMLAVDYFRGRNAQELIGKVFNQEG